MHQSKPEMSELNAEESAPAPVFVDQSGLRGRLLRGVGWPVSVVGAVLAVAMGGSLIGVQADAPAMGIPAQPSRSSGPPPLSPTPSSASSATSPPRTLTRSATPGAKTSAVPPKTAAAPSASAAARPKPASPASKPAMTAPNGAKPSARPAKQP